MTNQLTTMLATPYYIESTSITITTDVTSSEVKTLPAGYYIPYLKLDQSSSFTYGTINDPYEVFQKFVSASSPTYFSFSLTSQGKTQIEYLGTGSGNITFSYAAQKMLGFRSNSLSFASQAVKHVSDYSPYSSIFSFAKTNNTGWTKTPQGAAYSMTPDGYVWGYKNSYDTYTQKFNLRFHPKDQTTQLSDPSINSTPLYYVSKSIYYGQSEHVPTSWYLYSWNNLPTLLDFSADSANSLGPFIYTSYTVQEFLQQCPGKPIHALLGNLQQCISGSNKEYLIVFQTPESIKKENQFKPSLANFDKLYDVEDFEISFYKKFTINTLSSSYVTASTAFSPSDISNLYAWYKYDNLTLNGAYVSAALDKSGNGRHAVQATAASQPLYYSSGGSNNKAYWNGVANTRYLLGGANNDFNFLHNGSDWTVVIVSKPSTNSSRVWFGTTAGSSNDAGFGIFEYTNPGAYFIMGNGTLGVINKAQATGYASGSWHSLAMTYTTGSTPNLSYSFDNGSVTGTANNANSNSASNSGRKLGIGSAGNGGFITDTAFHEVILYNKKLSAGELAQIQTYLNTEYGL